MTGVDIYLVVYRLKKSSGLSYFYKKSKIPSLKKGQIRNQSKKYYTNRILQSSGCIF